MGLLCPCLCGADHVVLWSNRKEQQASRPTDARRMSECVCVYNISSVAGEQIHTKTGLRTPPRASKVGEREGGERERERERKFSSKTHKVPVRTHERET